MEKGLYLVCCVDGTWIGLPAAQVEAVVKVGEIIHIPHAPNAVRGLVAIRSRLLTVVDTAVVAGAAGVAASADAATGMAETMAVLSIEGYGYGLTLDVVDDVVEFSAFQPILANLSTGWRRLASHMVDYRGRIILIVDPQTLVDAVLVTHTQAA